MIKRLLTPHLDKTPKSILVLGPRQVGKSTLLESLSPQLVVNLARESEFLDHSMNPSLLEELIDLSKPKSVMIDEIQRLPSLLNTIQAILDSKNNKGKLRFFLSGSSARKLKRGQANMLPGRLMAYTLGGLCAQELQNKVNTKRALKYGFLPEIYLSQDDSFCESLLRSYAGTYLKEEIQAESIVRQIQGFARFLKSAADNSGNILDFSKISTKAKVSRSSCVRFFEILEDTLIASKCEVFAGAGSADVIQHPKYYFFDVGVLNALLGDFGLSSDRLGRLNEHLLHNQLLNSAHALNRQIRIDYFRTRNRVEVDFVITLEGKVWAVEVKTGTVSDSEMRSLRIFRDYFPAVDGCFVVAPGQTRMTSDKIVICDWIELLKRIGLTT